MRAPNTHPQAHSPSVHAQSSTVRARSPHLAERRVDKVRQAEQPQRVPCGRGVKHDARKLCILGAVDKLHDLLLMMFVVRVLAAAVVVNIVLCWCWRIGGGGGGGDGGAAAAAAATRVQRRRCSATPPILGY